MNLKLNTESTVGQWLSTAAGQAGGKGKGEDFEQMLLNMSASRDDLTASPAEKAVQNVQRPSNQGGQSASESKDGKPAVGKADKAVNNQSGDGQSASVGEEPVEVQELAAILGMPQMTLNFAEVPERVQLVEAVTENAAPTQAAYQEAAPRLVQVNDVELAAPGEQTAENGQPEVLEQFAAVAEGAETEQADTQRFDDQTARETVGRVQTEEEPEAEVLQVSGRVFEEPHTPVKVAEAEHLTRTVQPEAADGAEQIARHIRQALQAGEQTVRINLNPANLGSLTVEISKLSDGTLSVILSAVTEKAAGLLEKHSAGLQTLLTNVGQGQVRVEVENRTSDQPTQQFLNPEGDKEQQQGRQQGRQERERQEAAPQDFLQQLRLGLISLEQAV